MRTTKEELADLIIAAERFGLYKAADFLHYQVERVLTQDQSYFENNAK